MMEHELRGLPVVGAVLSADLAALVRDAVGEVRDSDAIPSQELNEAVEMLVERYALSLKLAKPAGIAMWAEHYAREFGRGGALDVAAAVSRTVAASAAALDLDRPRFESFLHSLDTEVAERAVERHHAPEKPEEKYAAALLAMVGARDGKSAEHARAVAHWARRLCSEMQLSPEMSDFVELCALLHDIGQISTPEAILNKPSGLTSVETTIVREHAAAGERILRGIPELERCADVVRSHHERWDGAGYPDRISGPNIPFESRIVAVADSFHAMISERPHRLPISPRIALDILAGGRGTQWDPDVVDALQALFRHARAEPAACQPVSSA
jgi:putative nucleotidyltransferase with HDIG domain